MGEEKEDELQRDIEIFFQPRVHDYLNKEIKRQKLARKLFSPSSSIAVIKAFEQEIEQLQSPETPDNEFLATLDLWKKRFTRNVLVPKYLLQNPHLDLAHVIRLMKRALIAACQEVKTETYVRSFRQTIVNSLRNIPPLERLKRAKQILTSSIKVIERLDKNFSSEKILSSFPQETLQELVAKAGEPLVKEPSPLPKDAGSRLVKRRFHQSLQKPEGLDLDLLRSFLRGHLISLISQEIICSPTLLAKMQTVGRLFAHLEKSPEILRLWIKEWTAKPNLSAEDLVKAAYAQLPFLIKQMRAEILAHSCLEEIMEAKQKSLFSQFAAEREEIILRYIKTFLQESELKHIFLDYLKEEERAEEERHLPPGSENFPPLTPKGPGSKSLWQKV